MSIGLIVNAFGNVFIDGLGGGNVFIAGLIVMALLVILMLKAKMDRIGIALISVMAIAVLVWTGIIPPIIWIIVLVLVGVGVTFVWYRIAEG